jgi:hypothetical protein
MEARAIVGEGFRRETVQFPARRVCIDLLIPRSTVVLGESTAELREFSRRQCLDRLLDGLYVTHGDSPESVPASRSMRHAECRDGPIGGLTKT